MNFKGALNLLKNYNYVRPGKLTSDMDYSLRNLRLSEAIDFLIKMIPKIKDNIYEFKFIEREKLEIATNGYSGVRIKFHAKNKGESFLISFHIDVAVEELKSGYTSYYSIERSIADKYVTMIQWGARNRREKDFIDIKELFKRCDSDFLNLLIGKLIEARKVKRKEIDSFKNVYQKIEYIKKYDLIEIIDKLNIKL